MSRVSEAWEEVSPDPDPNSDLGYELQPLTVINVEEGAPKYMFLPGEEDRLKDDEFIVATSDSVCTLEDCR